MRPAKALAFPRAECLQIKFYINSASPNQSFSNKLHYINFIEEKNMGQQQFAQLKRRFLEAEQPHPLHPPTPYQLVNQLQNYASELTDNNLTYTQLKHHLLEYFNLQLESGNANNSRRRSYQLIQIQQLSMEKNRLRSKSFSRQCMALEDKMQWLQEIQELVQRNITDIMANQKSYNILQSFRKLILNLFKIDNLFLCAIRPQGQLQFHDFKANQIRKVRETEPYKKIGPIIKQSSTAMVSLQLLQLFGLNETTSAKELFRWGVCKEETEINLLYVWKNHPNSQISHLSVKMMKEIANLAMLSSVQHSPNFIQNYSRDLLHLLELCVYQSQAEICNALGLGFTNLQELYTNLINNCEKAFLACVCSYKQIQYQLLENIRTYKKYLFEDDKIYMDFNETAQLTFISNNFKHPLTQDFTKIADNQKYYLEKIFQNYQPINDFLKKAVLKKIKGNKLYSLDFQTKARVRYDEDGRIIRLNVIIQDNDGSSSSSSSNVYCSSSTKILSEQSQKDSEKDLPELQQVLTIKGRRPSILVRNLQKSNPGIINQGWINLFIKDHHMAVRKNDLKRDKLVKTNTKRSFSLNHAKNLESQEAVTQTGVNIQSTDLNLLQLEEEQLQPLVLQVFRKLEYFHTPYVKKPQFQNFIRDVHKGYQMHNNPFHNFTHGVNVMHTCYLLSQATRIKQVLTPFKLFSVVLSGLCHDVGHTGFTNLFEIASNSKKAITYNDTSPLQNFHASYTFQLLSKPENNFLKGLSPQELKQFRKSVINNILFTDIKEHFPLLKKFNGLIKDEVPKNDEYVNILTSMIVHSADFGGSTKDFEICKAWSLKVNLQFSNQYKMEGELGLPQTPFMKDLTNITILSKNEAGFLKVIVFPLYQALDQFCENDSKVRKLRQYAQNNIKKWQEIHVDSIKSQWYSRQRDDYTKDEIVQDE